MCASSPTGVSIPALRGRHLSTVAHHSIVQHRTVMSNKYYCLRARSLAVRFDFTITFVGSGGGGGVIGDDPETRMGYERDGVLVY